MNKVYKYVFYGWSIDGEKPTYAPGNKYIENKDLKLYALWKEEYTIAYDANGGEGAPEPQIKY